MIHSNSSTGCYKNIKYLEVQQMISKKLSRILQNNRWSDSVKNNADALIFHTTICVEAPQIVLMHRAKTATLLFARASSAALRNGGLK